MRILAVLTLILTVVALPLRAQQDSIFDSYSDYAAFVDEKVMTRDFEPLILRLGGRDEYSPEQVAQINGQLRSAWPRDFDHVAVFREEDLGGGMRQEGRVYWTGSGYAYFYALLHDRPDGFVVLSFHLNTQSAKVLERF